MKKLTWGDIAKESEMTKAQKVEVYAWVATPKQAASITAEQLGEIRKVFGERLAIEKRQDGALALYTSDEKIKVRLAALMIALQLFEERVIYVRDSSSCT